MTRTSSTCDTKRMSITTSIVRISSMAFIIAATACGPCEDTIVAGPGGNIVQHLCIPDDDGGAEVGESGIGGGSGDEGGNPTEPGCGITFGAGEDFGPCAAGTCNADASKCAVTKSGTVCMPECDSCSPEVYGECLTDLVCGLAGPECAINCANGQGCFVAGMVCDAPSGLCVWPVSG